MLLIKYIRSFGIAVSACLLVYLFSAPTAIASLQGSTTVDGGITSSHTPTISGTIPSWCSDILVGIGTDQSNYNDYAFFFSDYGQVLLTDNGYDDTSWSLSFAANNFWLQNGVYNIYVSSECDYSGTYDNPLYDDIHYSVLSIVPSSCDNLCVPVYRFYNTQNGTHFYTSNEHEKRQVLTMRQFRYEGIANYAKNYRTVPSGMTPVHRFYNYKQGVHFYTANQYEASRVNDSMYDTYRYEGVSYYTYNYQKNGSTPVHRFYKFNQGVHFFTSNQSEASKVNDSMYDTYRYEGVSYYNMANK